jgi:hypothetical protein
MKRLFFALGLTLPAVALPVPHAWTAETPKPTRAEKALLERVVKRLLDVCEPVAGVEWPPGIDIEGDGIAAGAAVYRKDGKAHALVRVSPEMMRKVVQGDCRCSGRWPATATRTCARRGAKRPSPATTSGRSGRPRCARSSSSG